MSRNVSTTFWEAVTSEITQSVFLVLVTLDHTSFASAYRFVYNTENVTSNGSLYTAYNFRLDPHGERDDGVITNAKLSVEAIDQQIIEEVSGISGPISVTLRIVLSDDPDTVEVGPWDYFMESITFDSEWIRGDLTFDTAMEYQVPALTFHPRDFPGLF